MKEEFKTHIMMDLETLSTKEDAVIVQFSAIAYHLEKDAKKSLSQLVDENSFNMKLSIPEQFSLGRRISQSTLDWWKTLPPEAQQILKPLPGDHTISSFHAAFKDFLARVGFVPNEGFTWTRGNIDIVWLDSLWRTAKLDPDDFLIKWWKVRDIRTAVDCSGVSSRFNGIPDGFWQRIKTEFPECIDHNSLHDCAKQILQLRMANVF